ncbi:hypothetical protein Tco_0472941 [Tanacetum coccineum]
MKILSVIRISVDKLFGYGYLKEIVVRHANHKEYVFNEADFSRLHLNDIEYMLLLYVQNKLHHLKGDVQVDLINALRLFTQRIVLKKRVEDDTNATLDALELVHRRISDLESRLEESEAMEAALERRMRAMEERSGPPGRRVNFMEWMNAKRELGKPSETRFGGNANSKKMQKVVFKQQFEAFRISNSEGLEKGYDMFQQLLSQLEAHGAEVSTVEVNET